MAASEWYFRKISLATVNKREGGEISWRSETRDYWNSSGMKLKGPENGG